MADDRFRATRDADVYDVGVWNRLIVERIDPLPGTPLIRGGDSLMQIVVVKAPKEGMN